MSLRLVSSLLALGAGSAAAQTPAAPDSAWWTHAPRTYRIPKPEYEGVERTSVYLRMPDGVRLAVDLYLPSRLSAGVRLPTLVEQTRYRRSVEFTPAWRDSLDRPPRDAAFFVPHGYAYLIVDVRGSGASFGTRLAEFHPDEVKDGKSIVDWIVAQPWSNGIVGAQGISYVGTTADLILVNHHPAVKAIAPTFALYDAYADIAFPGGLRNQSFLSGWGQFIRALDRDEVPEAQRSVIVGVRPVDADTDRALLRAALAEHANNVRIDEVVNALEYRDDRGPNGMDLDATSTHRYQAALVAARVPIYGYSGWFDGGYGHSAIKRFLSVRTPGSRLVLGPWSHAGRYFWAPDRGSLPTSFDRQAELLRFFDYHLKGIANGFDREPPIAYYTMGENRWKTARRWPIPAAKPTRWYLAANGALSPRPSPAGAEPSRYQSDSTAGTGDHSRWNTLLGGGPVVYPERTAQDAKLLTFTSPPLERDVEVTGHPVVTIELSTTATDGALFAYLESVGADGKVFYLTEGELRLSARAIATNQAPYRSPAPYRTLRRRDARPVEAGSVVTLTFDLLPTSYRYPRGSRIRLTLAGADRDHFSRVGDGAPTLTVWHDARRISWIELPIVPPRG